MQLRLRRRLDAFEDLPDEIEAPARPVEFVAQDPLGPLCGLSQANQTPMQVQVVAPLVVFFENVFIVSKRVVVVVVFVS